MNEHLQRMLEMLQQQRQQEEEEANRQRFAATNMVELQRRLAQEAENARARAQRELEVRRERFQEGLRQQAEEAARATAAAQAEAARQIRLREASQRRRRSTAEADVVEERSALRPVCSETLRNQLLAASAALRSTIETAKRQLADQEEQLANIERLLSPPTPAPSGDSDNAPICNGERRLTFHNTDGD
jgi:dTMP kinase